MLTSTKITGFADEIHADLKIQVQLLKKLGIQYLELRSANGRNVSEISLQEAKEIKKYLWENGLRVSAIGSPIGKIQINDEFEPHFAVYQRIVEIAKLMETPYIRMFSFYLPEDGNPDHYREQVFERMHRMISYAAQEQVILLHENEKGIFGDTASRCLQLFEQFYGEHFKGTFDFANFIQCGEDTRNAFELLQPYIEYIHIKDALLATGEVTPAGEGDGKVGEILSLLDASGYNGFLSLEPHLFDFAGLKNLEKDAGSRTMTDGEAAFLMAYEALMKIIK